MHLIGWESGARFLGQWQGRLLSKTSGIPGHVRHWRKKFTDILFKLLLASFMSCLLFCSEEAEEYKRKLIQVRKRQARGQAVSHYSSGFSSLKRGRNFVFFFLLGDYSYRVWFLLKWKAGERNLCQGGERQSKGRRGVGTGRYNPMFLFCSLLQFDICTVLFGGKEGGNSVSSFGIQAVTVAVARGICFRLRVPTLLVFITGRRFTWRTARI